MRYKVFLILTLMLSQPAFAQYNYVPNSSFEMYTQCPTQFSQIERCHVWEAATAGTADYLRDCNNGSDVSIPVNYMGNQEAHSGVAYAGIIIYSTTSIYDYKEYLEVELKNTLIAGMPYKVSFYCSLAEYVSTFASEDLGAVLAPGNVGLDIQYTSITQVAPPVKIDGFISNTTDWVKVEGIYIAMGGESHMTIGAFKKSSAMDVMYVNPSGNGFAYYFIDDVAVEIDLENEMFGENYGNGYDSTSQGPNAYYEDGCLYDVIIPNVFTPNADAVNDSYFIKYWGYIKSEIVILDRWGETVFESDNFFIEHWDGAGKSDGLFFYALNMMKQDGTYDNFTGSIQIIGE